MTPAPSWTDEHWNDMVDLLTYVAAADRRTVGTTDVKVWLDAARDGEWPSLDFAYRAVVRHRNEHPGQWLEPGHITQAWRALRRAAGLRFHSSSEEVPDYAAHDPAAYKQWVAAAGERHRQELLVEFMRGGDPMLNLIESGS